ncbi:pyridoxal phosphate-dependent enzyme [Thermoanaerobacterium thermosaccharolyticum DSM 571]|uniref:Pyridoxal phosphate-dependent enzyme n=1 Tax=Thermoanaerobacterium thermosaccharolyticum (strain ATCC 7956 / DSM 571 / NCIMB 9385 / NCA 3814 / NCTC 13789 / WDCM 00135 / 2032) TaxID=580327 RepID=D9TQ14_THETC|nr:DgaE family pyridoxal phosphate-dependent ammonia lyase [Thermoanaerobacterium thermosaccharolyticum]ADL69183.1 pyridoxal phosphate-dependent enzyme [Thermoanaerobacterium thermosaccharolyticum DSM 571]
MNVYEKIGLKKVINASGKMTALGATAVSQEVAEMIKKASMEYVEISSLIDKAGEIISKYTGGDDSCVTVGASAGIAISVAATIAKDNLSLIEKMPKSDGLKNEIIIQKGHSINFGAPINQMIMLGGGIPVEVGQANKVEYQHVEKAINDKTTALIYIKSHHTVQKGMLSIEKMIEIAHNHKLPLIIDAAAEEDLKKYVKLGADMVIYSGGKAIGGPTSGFITGKEEWIKYCKEQYKGIGRAMKVGKENIMGLLKAIELYGKADVEGKALENRNKMNDMVKELNLIKGIEAVLIRDEAGRDIYRARIKIDEEKVGMTAFELIKRLETGDIAIYTRDYYANIGYIDIDPRPLNDGDEKIIISRIAEIINSKK